MGHDSSALVSQQPGVSVRHGYDEDRGFEEGWFTDPYGRHEARWLSDGVPTRLVRDQGDESYDDPPPDAPPTQTPNRVKPLAPADEGADLNSGGGLRGSVSEESHLAERTLRLPGGLGEKEARGLRPSNEETFDVSPSTDGCVRLVHAGCRRQFWVCISYWFAPTLGSPGPHLHWLRRQHRRQIPSISL